MVIYLKISSPPVPKKTIRFSQERARHEAHKSEEIDHEDTIPGVPVHLVAKKSSRSFLEKIYFLRWYLRL